MTLTRKPSSPVTIKRATPTLATLVVGVALHGCIEVGEPLEVGLPPLLEDQGPEFIGQFASDMEPIAVGLVAQPSDMEPIEVGLPPELEDMEPEPVVEFAPDMEINEEINGDMGVEADMEPIVVGLPPLPEDMGAPEGGDEG